MADLATTLTVAQDMDSAFTALVIDANSYVASSMSQAYGTIAVAGSTFALTPLTIDAYGLGGTNIGSSYTPPTVGQLWPAISWSPHNG